MRLLALIIFLLLLSSCGGQNIAHVDAQKVVENPQTIPVADRFEYPIGKTGKATAKKDNDGWYNALDFGEDNHLGEDWNGDGGGNTDCGEPVYAAANGTIVFTGRDILGWGNVMIVRHRLKDGKLVETLYGHLKDFAKTSGDVKRRERIGSVGDGGGIYKCHLHFELREQNSPIFGQVGRGYSSDRAGWTDPSDFIDKNR